MNKLKGIAVAMTTLMASGAFAATAVTLPAGAKSVAKKTTSLKAATTKSASAKALLSGGKPESTSRADKIGASSSSSSRESSVRAGMTSGSSIADAPSALKKSSALDKMKLGVLFEYYGASVSDPLSGKQTDKKEGWGQSADPIELWTTFNAGYKLSSNLTLSANVNFQTVTDTEDKTADDYDPGSKFRFRSDRSYLKLGVGKFVQAGKFKWNGDFRLYGTGIDSRTDGLQIYFRNGHNFTYAITPKLTLAAYNTLRYYQRSDVAKDANPKAIDLRATVGPAIEYQATDALGLSTSFNMDFARNIRTGSYDETANFKGPDYGSFFEVGASIDATKNINVNPYFDFYPATPNMDAAQMGVNLALTVL